MRGMLCGLILGGSLSLLAAAGSQLGGAAATGSAPAADHDEHHDLAAERRAEQRLLARLEEPVALDLHGEPLHVAFDRLGEHLGVAIRDRRRRRPAPPVEPPPNVSGWATLHWLLRDVELSWGVADGAIVVTDGDPPLAMQAYQLRDLAADGPDGAEEAVQELAEAFEQFFAIDWGQTLGTTLLLRQDLRQRREMLACLAAIERLKQRYRDWPEAAPLEPLRLDSAAEAQAAARLSRRLPAVLLHEASFTDAIAYFAEQLALPLVLSPGVRRHLEVMPHVSLSARDISAREALDLLCGETELDWSLAHEAVCLHREFEAEEYRSHSVRIYPVRDLAPDHAPDDRSAAHLAATLRELVSPDSWNEVGGDGHLARLPGCDALLVRQTDDGHRAIERALYDLLQAQGRLGPSDRAALRREWDREPITAWFDLTSSPAGSWRVVGQRVAIAIAASGGDSGWAYDARQNTLQVTAPRWCVRQVAEIVGLPGRKPPGGFGSFPTGFGPCF